MAQTLTTILVHIIYSTKDRQPLISPEIEPRLYGYIGAICKTHESPLLAANGTRDHVHLLVSQSKNIALADLVMVIRRTRRSGLRRRAGSLLCWDGRMATPACRSAPRSGRR